MSCFTVYTLNALTFLEAYDHSEYADVLNRANLTLADGVGALWAITVLAGEKPERVSGVDFIHDLCQSCVEHKQTIYMLGGKDDVALRAANQLQKHYTDLRLAGWHSGYWSQAEEMQIVKDINASKAAVLMVGLGQPRQEHFLDQYKEELQPKVGIGIGGSFDVLANDLNRAPIWIQQFGLEWLYRLIQEPWRLNRIKKLPRFIWLVVCYRLRRPQSEVM